MWAFHARFFSLSLSLLPLLRSGVRNTLLPALVSHLAFLITRLSINDGCMMRRRISKPSQAVKTGQQLSTSLLISHACASSLLLLLMRRSFCAKIGENFN